MPPPRSPRMPECQSEAVVVRPGRLLALLGKREENFGWQTL